MKNEKLNKIIAWNADQLQHVRIFQQLFFEFGNILNLESINHDKTKFEETEYRGFLDAHEGLKSSKDGPSEEYKKQCRNEAIVHHVENNSHHPEYWKKKNMVMPFTCIIAMYFDWVSRTIVNDGYFTEKWWNANLEKCEKTNQKHAIPIVESLKRQFPPERFSLDANGKIVMNYSYHSGVDCDV